MGTSHDILHDEIWRLKEIIKKKNRKIFCYRKAYNILMDNFDYIPEEDRQEVSDELEKVGL